jgi:hypothetical protein
MATGAAGGREDRMQPHTTPIVCALGTNLALNPAANNKREARRAEKKKSAAIESGPRDSPPPAAAGSSITHHLVNHFILTLARDVAT